MAKKKFMKTSMEVVTKLATQFHVTEGCVWQALSFTTNSGLAKSIRIAAKELDPGCYFESKEPTNEDLC